MNHTALYLTTLLTCPCDLQSPAGMLAPDGRCKTLDAAADGYVRSEGVGALILRKFSMTADSNSSSGSSLPASALAWLRSTAVNQDGRSSSLTAPNGPAQQEVVRRALAAAGVAAGALTTLEMHGTGGELQELEINYCVSSLHLTTSNSLVAWVPCWR